MAYSHLRLRNTLALVRILTGVLFLFSGWPKVSSVEYARIDFPAFLWAAMHGSGVPLYAKFLETYMWPNTTKYAVFFGFVELTIGVGLVLGLTVRPVCLLGMAYMTHLMLATWGRPALGEPLWNFPVESLRYAVPFLVFLLLGVGQAGENWGLGALYHRRRHKRWEKNWEIKMVSGLPPMEAEQKTATEQ